MNEPRDPWAAAVANASLLGLGYVLLRRWRLAAGTGLVTAALLTVLVATGSVWAQAALAAWWALMIAHGWRLAARGPVAASPGQRGFALAVALPVLLVVAAVRTEAAVIDNAVDQARADRDCAAAVAATDRVNTTHRVGAAPLAADLDRVRDACAAVAGAHEHIAAVRGGRVDEVNEALRDLSRALPDGKPFVDAELENLVETIERDTDCTASTITSLLHDAPPGDAVVEQARASAARIAPPALLRCAERYENYGDLDESLDLVTRLATDHPDAPEAGKAKDAVHRLGKAIERRDIQALMRDTPTGPRYCANPKGFSDAPEVAAGSGNRALVLDFTETITLPGDMRTTELDEAAMVLCVQSVDLGPQVDTCDFTLEDDGSQLLVRYHKALVSFSLFELRTGKSLASDTVTVAGASCPSEIEVPPSMSAASTTWSWSPRKPKSAPRSRAL
ncbi:tetratricopeptide repeat protein [Actinokineospora sp. G85]|uniref:tetratricopeptide repeat protein n=1 Tax=Actinokineospora sp. G85 TaxID=3406626 RepID=UPI003C766AC5